MNNRPKISVITVTLNVEDTIEETVLSVLNQTYKNIEYIIIDGKSQDKTVEVIKKYMNKIDHFVSERDSGIYNAMNSGARVAKGDYLYFLNSGDTLANENILEEIVNELSDVDFLYGKVRVVGKSTNKSYIRGAKVPRLGLRLGMKVKQQSMFIKKEVFNKVGGLNEKYKIAADFDLLCKILDNNFSVKRIDTVVCNYDDSGISSDLRKSYGDTALVIKDRYGRILFNIYFVISRVKLIIHAFIENIIKLTFWV